MNIPNKNRFGKTQCFSADFKESPEELKKYPFFRSFNPRQYKGLTKDEFRAQYEDLFKKYTTPKKREYAGKPTSFGYPAKYQGLAQENITELVLMNKNRCEVTCQVPTGFKQTIKFIALRKQGVWLLDSVKSYSESDDKWSNSIL
ncbi:MAG: RhsIA family immunity protein [Oscillospiraceae bacterium]|nr:RhsIA family immunity protein [Oscillospiraceae bacterium]